MEKVFEIVQAGEPDMTMLYLHATAVIRLWDVCSAVMDSAIPTLAF